MINMKKVNNNLNNKNLKNVEFVRTISIRIKLFIMLICLCPEELVKWSTTQKDCNHPNSSRAICRATVRIFPKINE